MSANDLQIVAQELIKAGLEIYRTNESEIEIAERVRVHIMDSGIRVRGDLVVAFTARTQRSDFGAGISQDQLFEKVREAVGRMALDRGYSEEAATTVDVRDPMDEARVLDTWYEVIYVKGANDCGDAVREVQWALEVEKFVTP